MKKTLTKASSKKSSKKKSPIIPMPRFPKSSTDRGTKPIKYITKRNGQLETEEDRKKRIAKKEATLLRMFQMTYDAYHKQ